MEEYIKPKLTFLKDLRVEPIGGTVELQDHSNGRVELWIRTWNTLHMEECILDAKQLYAELKNYFENEQQKKYEII